MSLEDFLRAAQEDADILHYGGEEHDDGVSFCEGCHQEWPCDFARENGVV